MFDLRKLVEICETKEKNIVSFVSNYYDELKYVILSYKIDFSKLFSVIKSVHYHMLFYQIEC